jgi:4-carboxymuconolactone decarboxylase
MTGDVRHAALAPLVAAAAAGRHDAVRPAAQSALAAGCTADEVREALLTMAPFCGFPRTLDAVALARPLLVDAAPAPASARSKWRARGAKFFDRVYGKDAARVRANLCALDAEVAAWIESDAYGKILSRPGISASLRERIAVILLAAQGLRNQLSGHVRGALNCGATHEEIAAFLDAASPHLAPAELAAARDALARAARG